MHHLVAAALPPQLQSETVSHGIGAFIIAVAALVLGKRLRDATVDVLYRRPKVDRAIALLLGRLVYFSLLVVAALWIVSLFGYGITTLLTVLGVVGLAVSLALQDVLRNLFAGVYLLVERPFTIGDLIEVKGVSGTVESVELRLTVLHTLDGLRVTVPNAVVFTEVLTNRSVQSFHRWPLLVALPPDAADLAKIGAAVESAARQLDSAVPPPLVAVQSATAKGTLLEVGWWAADRTALGQGILALRRALPRATVSVPGAPALPDPLPAPAKRPRYTRARPRRAARSQEAADR